LAFAPAEAVLLAEKRFAMEWGNLRSERQWGGMNGASGGETNKKKAKSKP
jgi:hypothetical protein